LSCKICNGTAFAAGRTANPMFKPLVFVEIFLYNLRFVKQVICPLMDNPQWVV
jgi:hypothetical protein